ncbi:MAG: DUF2088 domain-containing protein [Candidatus Thorarchaeota archaeon]|nr:DUF2088 domain-containing protein [Candidatus Thorarchaeota archaeon]
MSYHRTPLNYGSTVVDEFIPKSMKRVKVLKVKEYKPDFKDFAKKLDEVLARPVGSKPFDQILREKYTKGKKIVILVDDNTRPNIHTRAILPLLTKRMMSLGVSKDDIRIMIASGSHGRVKPEAIEKKVLRELYGEWKDQVLTHDSDSGNRAMGKTSRGTPILIDEQVLDSCLVIALSDSEYHYFAGQAGTVKLFCPGVAGRETIRINHPRMFDLEKGFVDGCRLGNTADNPVIQDMIEIVQIMQKHLTIFCIDTIIDHGEIVYVQAGDIIECHKAASAPLRKLRVADVDTPADIVFVSVGELGINLYQAGKGVHAAWNAVRHDQKGWIVLLAPCEEGIGSAAYEEAMLAVKGKSVKEALKYVIQTYCSEKTFKIGNQKPPDLFRILLDVREGDIKVVTMLKPDVMRDVYRMEAINPASPADVRQALRDLIERWKREHPDNTDPVIYVLPDSGLLIQVHKPRK